MVSYSVGMALTSPRMEQPLCQKARTQRFILSTGLLSPIVWVMLLKRGKTYRGYLPLYCSLVPLVSTADLNELDRAGGSVGTCVPIWLIKSH